MPLHLTSPCLNEWIDFVFFVSFDLQVCQSIPAYTETNLLNNRSSILATTTDAKQKQQNCFDHEPLNFHNSSTISPIYLSRQLNAIPCSIAVCRDDSISILAMIELSRRFSNGLWSSIQFWACCGCTLAIINTVCACLALPPLLTPFSVVYLMCVIVPLLSMTLIRTETDPEIMNRATAKKHNAFDSKAFVYAMGAYGCKFLPTIIITASSFGRQLIHTISNNNHHPFVLQILSFCTIMSHPVSILRTEINEFYQNLDTSRCFVLYAIVLHFGKYCDNSPFEAVILNAFRIFTNVIFFFLAFAVTISISFVHRDCSIWRKSPLTNSGWLIVANLMYVQFWLHFYVKINARLLFTHPHAV